MRCGSGGDLHTARGFITDTGILALAVPFSYPSENASVEVI